MTEVPFVQPPSRDEEHPIPQSRRTVLVGAALGVVGAATATTAGAPFALAAAVPASASGGDVQALASIPGNLLNVTKAWLGGPSDHPLLGDWRRVGYRRGISVPKAPKKVVTAVSLGIKPNTSADVSARLQSAVDALGAAGGGTLLLAKGRYVLSNPLFIHDSNVVVRGEGKKATTLFFTRPLRESVGPAPVDTQEAWSWTGGQIFFLSRERLAASRAAGWAGTRGVSEGWLPGDTLTDVAAASRGSSVLLVDDTSKLTAGEMMMLEVDNGPDHALLIEMAGDVAGASEYDWAARAQLIASPSYTVDFHTWKWPVKVAEILSPRTVRLEQPLRVALTARTPARLRALGPTVHDSGVEDLTIENALLPQTTHNINPGSNGVCFQAVYDCWAKNIHVLNADLAFGMTSAKSCTLSGISAGGRSLHHFVACRVMSHDNLIEDFTLEEFTIPAVPGSYLHGNNVEGLSSGNVYRRGVLKTGTFDSHRALPFENLRTAITVNNKDAVLGGGRVAGPYFGCRTVHWGITVTNGNNLGMDITDIAPRSLTAGITGLAQRGSILPRGGQDFTGDLESETLAFGTDLGRASDLLEIQRKVAPVG